MSTAGVVAALSAEARTLGLSTARADGLAALGDGTLVAVSGIGSTAAAIAARALADAGAAALVSWGMAGGLDPSLQAGTICLPHSVMFRDGARFGTDHHWRELIGAAIAARRTLVGGTLLTCKVSVDDVAGKAEAFRETGAAAVDMESAAVAEIAANRGLPFIAVRVVVDTAGDTLPAAVVAASTAGQVRISTLLQGLCKSPHDIASVFRLAKRYRAATRALAAVARTGALARLAFAANSATRIA